MSDFTIIVPHRGCGLGLWATIHSCELELERSEYNYNYVVVTNGEALQAETQNTLDYLAKTGRLLKHIHSDDPMSPPQAREVGAAVADGEVLFFFDNHCLVAPCYFKRAMFYFEENKNIDILHSTTRFYVGDFHHYHYKLKLEYNFWASSSMFAQYEHKPYQIAAAGHGGFAARKSVWDAVGGYGPSSLLRGYGGEELIFDLKAGMLGKAVYLDPKLIHFHYTGDRGYSRHYTDEYYTNMLVSANVIGGEKWLYKVFDSFQKGGHLRVNAKDSMYDLMLRAYERSAEYARELASKSLYSLDELLGRYRQSQVAM